MVTSNLTPEQTIRARLEAPRVVLAARPAAGTSGWQAETATGGFDAKPESIHFVKVRGIPGCEVHAVTFGTTAGRTWRFFCCVRQDSAGVWHFDDGAGGSADEDSGLQRPEPWVNLGGGGWPHRFYAGGTVITNGEAIARVRLRAANGAELEDSVDDGIVVFVTADVVRLPVEAELLDRAGALVSRHHAFG